MIDSHEDYSGIVNLLDYTSGSFPVTFADRSLDLEMPDYRPMNQADEVNWRACGFSESCRGRSFANKKSTDQKDLFDGAPVGLQVMGRRFEEEKVFGLMEAIVAALEDYQTGQRDNRSRVR